MPDKVEIGLTLKAKNAASTVLYDRTVNGEVNQNVTHQGRFTVTGSATDELHQFPDIPVLASAKNTFAVFIVDKDSTVKVGSAANEARVLLAGVPAMMHDIADLGKYYFSTAQTEAVDVQYFVGEVVPAT